MKRESFINISPVSFALPFLSFRSGSPHFALLSLPSSLSLCPGLLSLLSLVSCLLSLLPLSQLPSAAGCYSVKRCFISLLTPLNSLSRRLIMAPVITPFFATRHSTFFSLPFMHSVSLNHLGTRLCMVGGKAHYVGYGRGSWPLSPARIVELAAFRAAAARGGGQQWGETARPALAVYPLVRSAPWDGTGRGEGTVDGMAPRPLPQIRSPHSEQVSKPSGKYTTQGNEVRKPRHDDFGHNFPHR